jgi:PAS domain S-box-containing protein
VEKQMKEEPNRLDEDETLRLILMNTAAETGREYLRVLVRNVCRALKIKGSWVTEYLPAEGRLRALAFWFDRDWVEHYEYDISGTPCEPVIESCRLVHFPDKILELFPRDPDLERLGAVSYMGVPLLDSDGSILGHLAALDSAPIPDDERLKTVFEVFAERAAAEVRRLRAERKVLDREEQLARLLDSAMDAILVLDGKLTIVRANPAAARVLGIEGRDLPGHEMPRFLDRQSMRDLEEKLRALGGLPAGERRFWFPRGLSARRADGSIFPAEATISCFETRGGRFHTLILRDVNDRLEAEKRIRLLAEEADYYRQAAGDLPGGGEILGKSLSMNKLFRSMKQVAQTDATVLILGETGTGKELIARSIHMAGHRSEGPLVRVNCAAIPGTLIESEFFGHERGAFTGATSRRQGRFALADKGSIFLDEVGELPLDLQTKLLRVLQEGEFEPLGATRTVKVDVRVIAATHRDLDAMVGAGEFREDLYYRLNVFPIQVPPLRDRAEDIPVLAEVFVARFSARIGRRIEPLGPAEIRLLKAYPWPGNVRELQNVIERALILSGGPRLELERAMPSAQSQVDRGPGKPEGDTAAACSPTDDGPILTAEELRDIERKNMQRALESTDWRVSGKDGAARLLGIPASTFSSRMKALSIRRGSR